MTSRIHTAQAPTADAVRVYAPGPDPLRPFAKTGVEIFSLTWRGLELRIAYERVSTGTADRPYSHLEVMTDPPRKPLPITETGYRSLFLPTGSIEIDGGPVAFVMRWLDHSAKSAAWRAAERDLRQGCLF